MLLKFPCCCFYGSPQQITLVDLGSILLADDGNVDISVSEQGAVKMSSTPIVGDTSPITGAVLKSLWRAIMPTFLSREYSITSCSSQEPIPSTSYLKH